MVSISYLHLFRKANLCISIVKTLWNSCLILPLSMTERAEKYKEKTMKNIISKKNQYLRRLKKYEKSLNGGKHPPNDCFWKSKIKQERLDPSPCFSLSLSLSLSLSHTHKQS